MNDQSSIYGVSMRGWIAAVLAVAVCSCELLKIPIDTQFFTIINSVLVAYVVQASVVKDKKEKDSNNETINGSSNGSDKPK